MRITSKGQVTIPKDIRKTMGFLPNTQVEFVVSGGRVVLRKQAGNGGRGERLIAALRGRGTVQLTTDQIMAMTRGA